MWFAQLFRKVADKDEAPKHKAITEQKFCVIQTKSITVDGRYSFCFDSLSMSPALILSASAKVRSFSSSAAFNDFVSGQKNILIPEGESGKIQKKSQFQRFATNDAFGLNAIFSK